MRINEVEKLLGITKANIRFYEKEGLLSPGRTDSGYRDYTEADILLLKEIIILRKIGIPVQQVADILDGDISLQDALTENVDRLNTEIEKLNGALNLTQRLQKESVSKLDPQLYWRILQQEEAKGLRFQSLVSDYIAFIAPTLSWAYFIPQEAWQTPRKWLKYLFWISVAFAGAFALLGRNFLTELISGFGSRLIGIGLWCIVLLPLFIFKRDSKKVKEFIELWLPLILIVATIIIFIVCITIPFI